MLVLSSPSGAGKTSICKEILKRDNELDMSISITTRPRRKSEVEGKDYIFVSEKKFEKLKKENFLLNMLRSLITSMELQKNLLKII